MTREKIWTIWTIFLSIGTLRDSPFNPTLCQNVMIIHQTIDLYMKFSYSLIIIDHQIDGKTLYIENKSE
jgi:hypothetical protein